MTRLSLRPLLALGALLGGMAFLHRATAGMPTSLSPTDPTLLVVTLLRSAALMAGAYLATAAALGAVARVGQVRPMVRALDRLTVPALRRLLDASLGVSVLATVTVTAPPSAWAEPPPVEGERPPITMLRLPDEAPEALPPSPDAPPSEPVPATTSSAVATDTTVAPEPVASTTTVAVSPTTSTIVPTSTTTTTAETAPPSPPSPSPAAPSTSRIPARPAASPPEPAQVGEKWTVQPGEHLWAIAQQVLARSWGREPSDADTDPYWRLLVEANRSRLADRDNPDLVFAGQVFSLPAPPPAPP